MNLLSEAFKALKSALGGDAVAELEAPANNGLATVLLSVKKKGSGAHYVVLANGRRFDGAEGEQKFSVTFSESDWEQFTAIAVAVQDYLTQHRPRKEEPRVGTSHGT